MHDETGKWLPNTSLRTFGAKSLSILAAALQELGWLVLYEPSRVTQWIDGHAPQALNEFTSQDRICLLRVALESRDPDGWLQISPAGKLALQALVEFGMTLMDAWPRQWSAATAEILGDRFYFTHQRNLAVSKPLASVASSQLGKFQAQLPNWPHLVDRALQTVLRRNERLLLVAATASDAVLRQLATRSELNTVEVILPIDGQRTAEKWLAEILLQAVKEIAGDDIGERENLRGKLWISPTEESGDTEALDNIPLRDRCLFALPDRVTVLHVREHGRIEQLIHRRLSNKSFPVGSVYLALDLDEAATEAKLDRFLGKGAVGWYCFADEQDLPELSCSTRNRTTHFAQQVTCKLPRFLLDSAVNTENWPFLVHCTRGNRGPLPDESPEKYRDRLWLAGSAPDDHPLLTLMKIVRDSRIVAGDRMTRTQVPCVSFSATPLTQLLERRRFQSHLQRWDWEPYGLLVRREALFSEGARPVIYGSEADYQKLDDRTKPLFQPANRKRAAREEEHWVHEREWRLLGNLQLDRLPKDSVTLFVRWETEARAVSRESPWPVFWLE